MTSAPAWTRLGDHVLAGFAALELTQFDRVTEQVEDGLHDVFERGGDAGVEWRGEGVNPGEELLPVTVGYAQHVAERLHRHGVADVGHEVERALLQRGVDDVDGVLAEFVLEFLTMPGVNALLITPR